MKRFFALLLALCLLLCACGKKNTEETTEATTTPTTVPPTTAVPTTEPETEPPTEATDPINLTHPLTGEQLDEPFTGRPVASTINNAPACLPQSGISQADWFYEIETEGGVTRCLGLFTDLDNIDAIGPVRSARTYFVNVACSFCAPLAHCGGSTFALKDYYSLNDIVWDYPDIDEMEYPSYFYRDAARRSQGYAYEHTLYTTGEDLKQAMADKGYDDVLDENGVDYGYNFAEEVSLDGDPAGKVSISFLGTKTTTMTYNKETGLYEAAQRGGDWIDGTTGETLSFNNVLVIYAEQNKSASPPLSFYDLNGEGTGYFATGGKIVPILWSRGDVYDPFVYTLENGTPITLEIGHTFAAVISTKGSVSFG